MGESILLVTLLMACCTAGLLVLWTCWERRVGSELWFADRFADETVPEVPVPRVEPDQLGPSKVKEAVSSLRNGCPCSRVLLATYGPALGLTRGEALEAGLWFAETLKAAETCGAVTGALTILAQRFPGAAPATPEGRAAAQAAMSEFSKRFTARHGTQICRELLRQKPANPDDLARKDGANPAQLSRCPELVEDAASILEALLRNGLGNGSHRTEMRLAA